MAGDSDGQAGRRGVKRAFAVLLACLAAAAGAAAYLYFEWGRPYRGFTGEVFVVIERGTSTRQIARALADRGVLEREWPFLAIRALRPRDVLHAGEYRFSQPASPWEVFDRLARGDVYYHTVTLPEGSNIFDAVEIISQLDWIDAAAVEAVVRSPALIADLDPKATTLEGYLFPSTYFVTRNTPAEEICRMMTDEFRRVWASLGASADVHETVTLASLVEKETAVPDERPLIASVFWNRLRRGMKLECDPTVIYAALIEGAWDGVIHRSDLARDNPYNTYLYPGLPPGPIANPGRESLQAVLAPPETNYLFFVALPDGSGRHEFSETIAAHNRAVGRYRRGIREAKRQGGSRRISGEPASGEDR